MEHVFYVNDNIGYVTVPVPENIYGNAKYQPDFMDVKIKGKNRFYYGSEVIVDELKVKINGNGNTLLIGSYTKLAGAIHIIGDNLTVFIGAGTTFQSVKVFCRGNNQGVYFGRDCMLSGGIEVRTSDSHSIISLTEKKKLNCIKGIFIGDHVWIGKKALIQKGTVIPEDNIIGFGAMVNKPLNGSNKVFAGVPVKEIKSGVTWSRSECEEIAISSLNDWRNLPYV
ncbi:hypothetical protein FFT88_17320 [Escherichia sp. E4930]|uniref:hypothetical protein n=1 Tax=Escherichia sp. E4930 TaxID=2044468 RepID=UPI00107F23DD|nr:hypothetical protein [Escherichia sp. E4930]TGB70597.1 hypothetical protein CRG96_06665 [Escherichia sp. E4930]TLU78362.1 hypothetical protein FFT88_17320 [Escherichia sp. E4930]